MSPEFCIEPCSLVVAKLALELVADAVLAKSPNGESDSVANSRVELCRKALEFVVGAHVDPDARALRVKCVDGVRAVRPAYAVAGDGPIGSRTLDAIRSRSNTQSTRDS